MKILLIMCFAVSIMSVVAGTRYRPMSSARRSFLSYIGEKVRNVSEEITELKQQVHDCCSQEG